MAEDFQIEGNPQAQLRRLAKDLEEAGAVKLKRKLYRNMNAAAKVLLEDAKREAAATLPRSGGAADRVAGASYRSRILPGKDTPGVKLRGVEIGSAKVNLKKINRGVLRHPLFGDREHWYDTPVRPGFWDRSMERGKPKAEEAVKAAIDEMVGEFYGGMF